MVGIIGAGCQEAGEERYISRREDCPEVFHKRNIYRCFANIGNKNHGFKPSEGATFYFSSGCLHKGNIIYTFAALGSGEVPERPKGTVC